MDAATSSFKGLFKKIHTRYGYDFTNYAEDSLLRRNTLFMKNLNIDSWDDLALIVLQDEQAFEEFIKYISVTVTEMFRDPMFYASLREKVVPALRNHPFIKVWVAGCATGEEAYSVAILLKEENLLHRSLIYATDINQKSLHIAKEGIYSISAIKAYTSNYMKSGGQRAFSEYYTAKYDLSTFDKSLRNNIVFAPHNLAVDQPFNEFQIIVCRNVLIYFNPTLQERVINLFYDSLSPLGFLGLGNKESLLFSSKRECFLEIDRKQRIFIKNEIPMSNKRTG